MDVKASLRHLRMAPRKVRLIVDLVRGLPVAEAELRLKFNQRAAARPVLKLLNSAVANAEHNFKLNKADLRIKTITADGGPTLKRMMPRAMGRGTTIRKRMTHVNLVLTDEKPENKSKVIKSKVVKSKVIKSKVPAAVPVKGAKVKS